MRKCNWGTPSLVNALVLVLEARGTRGDLFKVNIGHEGLAAEGHNGAASSTSGRSAALTTAVPAQDTL